MACRPLSSDFRQWSGSLAGKTRSFACDIGLEPRTTLIEAHGAIGMAEAFIRTIKREYVRVSPCPDLDTVMHQLSAWINHYTEARFTRTRQSRNFSRDRRFLLDTQ